MKAVLAKAMQAADDYVVSLDYLDSKGVLTRRIVSPIRFCRATASSRSVCAAKNHDSFISIACHNIKLCRASDFVMPVPVFAVSTIPMACEV